VTFHSPVISRLLLALVVLAVPIPASAAEPLESRLTSMSRSGNGEAAYHLGMVYHLGLAGVAKDAKKAFELFKLAADAGDPLGAYKLGCFYDGQGEGVVKSNAELALRYKLRAAKAGYALAQQDVARHLLDRGDTKGALRWLEAAAAQDDLSALMVLAALHSGEAPGGFPKVPADRVKSFTYMLIAVREVPEMRKAFEKEARAALVPNEYDRVMASVAAWREARTPVTQKADEGLGAAYKLAGLPAPAQ